MNVPSVNLIESTCKATTTGVFNTLAVVFGFELVEHEGRRFAYRPGANPCSPLVVCHADTVEHKGEQGHTFSHNEEKNTVHSIALDDRLGIACMLHAITYKTWMADCAMLVCDEEEVGKSTSQEFAAHEHGLEPNWLVELDRRGADAVMYEYETAMFGSFLEQAGFDIGQGSFSDICYLESLGVCGFNIGIGYNREHSDQCYAELDKTKSQLEKLETFYNNMKHLKLTHRSAPYGRYSDTESSYYDNHHYGSLNEVDLIDCYGVSVSADDASALLWELGVDFHDFVSEYGDKDTYQTAHLEQFCNEHGLDYLGLLTQ